MKLVLIPLGKFWMGSPKKEKNRFDDEEQHEVEITKDFYLGVYEVTQEQWQAVMPGDNPSWFSRDGKGKDGVKDIPDAELKQFPVESVSWNDVQDYLKKLNARDRTGGWEYRLPSARIISMSGSFAPRPFRWRS